MAAKAQTVTPVSRLSRFGLALGIKSLGSNSQVDDWYIPYNGPYESPKSGTHSSVGSEWNSVFARMDEHQSLTNSALGHGEEVVDGGRRIRFPSIMSVSTTANDRYYKYSSFATLPSSPFRNRSESIGDTPIPRQRSAPGKLMRRLSLASLLSIVPSSKKQPTSRTHVVQIQNGVLSTTSTSSHKTHNSTSSQHHESNTHAHGSNLDDLYLSNNLSANTSPPTMTHQPAPSGSQLKAPTTSTLHPYAIAYPAPQPVISNHGSESKDHVTFLGYKDIPSHLKPASRASALKASISTPDLRTHNPSKSKTHWLSAETWCDALLFPRPRFAVRYVDDDKQIVHERIVSPPGSPILSGVNDRSKSLKKSKSVVDFQTSNFAAVAPTRIVQDLNEATTSLNTHRPRSFALDDLAVPSPIPSLATVLADGQNLQEERKLWEKQAASSIGNKRSRSLSRARSKSQNSSSKPRLLHSDAGAFDFLASVTLLGNQPIAPVVLIDSQALSSRGRTSSTSGLGFGTFSFSSASNSRTRSASHGQSNSIGTFSEDLGRKHNRSLGTVLKRARTAAVTIFGAQEELHDGNGRDAVCLEDALTGDRTKPIHPSDYTRTPGQIDTPMDAPDGLNCVSPIPSGLIVPEEGIGLAFSSPPPSDGHFRPSYEDPIKMPAHPYAQSAMHSNTQSLDSAEQHSRIEVTKVYRQPIIHPYASYGGHLNLAVQENRISPAKKMFAQAPSGLVREVLPDEFQYSPFVVNGPGLPVPTHGSVECNGEKGVKRHSDTLHTGEVLNLILSNRGSPDSGFGASEDHHPFGPAPAPAAPTQAMKPIQRRPIDPPKLDFSDNTAVLFPLPKRKTKQSSSKFGLSQFPGDDLDHLHNAKSVSPPPGNVIPSLTIKPLISPGEIVFSGYSGSSLDKSRDSSPPISLGSLGRLDDFERFNDLFYKPTLERLPSLVDSAKKGEDLSNGVDETVGTDRTEGGFASLAQQLGDDLSELNADKGSASGSVVWGMQFSGSNGERPTDTAADPDLVLRRSWSGSALSNLALRVRTDTSLGAMKQSFPEDISDRQISDDLRLGRVEVVTTPPPVRSVRRVSSSAHVTLGNPPGDNERVRVTSSASLGLRRTPPPSTGVTRLSFMTNDTNISRISGLSDFPRPPSGSADIRESLISSYYGSTLQLQQEDENTLDSPVLPKHQSRPPLEWHESFRAAFGGEVDAGVARAL